MHNSRMKLYEKIVREIERQIRNGAYPPGTTLATETDMMAKYDVSRSTVRRALSQLQQKGLITREAGRGTFVRKPAPESVYLAVYDSFSNLFDSEKLFFRIWQALASRMSEADMEIHAVSLDSRRPLSEALLANYAEGIRGVMLLTYYPVTRSDLVTAIDKGLPCVLLNRYVHAPGIHSVTLDDFGGARRAVHYLSDLGHEKIGFLTRKSSPGTTFQDRLKGYEHGMSEVGLSPQMLIISEDPQVIQAELRRAKADGVSAVITISGNLAVSVKREAEHMGLHVPRDLSIIGFGDTARVTSEYENVTHVDYRSDLIGQIGAETMLNLLNGSTGIPSRRIIPTRIVKGNTVTTIKD